ncbi:YajQ family cyclic di-GMP-binding protein [Azospirillum sp. RWY-5-1]|uniref:Nucleotide-binding protein HND93_24610 n=1 Tax=Azospirillum oleiclasticum TaxID=2735135 RepID=A0ABX2TEY9_9PROT|nr:YajQ family cyclic di-GMP-binding protein [Azospirillum oleiclasticum]NYZ15138.1 YajQ family cyclic di-GMP-binding protein [Azospirillum oleiclasticum]NYZ22901.1 YajQ family cyclic di-GMP-binding protein [Azospirillum oleiclasticum]
MPSFDIVSKTDVHEMDNAVAGVVREIEQRFDFKGSKCTVERVGEEIVIAADDDLKLKQIHELLKVHVTRRKLDPGFLDFSQKVEKATGNTVRQTVPIRQGIAQDLAKTIVKAVKDSKIKVQVAIQGDELRVTGKKRDDLQAAIQHVRGLKVEQPLQYVNFRD